MDYLEGINTQRCSNVTGDACENGQASFWYSQGCFIGCSECDNESGRRQVDLCNSGKNQTLVDRKFWSVNRDAIPFSDLDIYRHNPWRSPGSAPVQDACGLAGGSYSRKAGAEAGDYIETRFARHGDVGTRVLGPIPNYEPPVYQRGGTIEATWSIRNNHGGGYQYRLCELIDDDLTKVTEACFQRTPLEFVEEEQSIVFPNGSLLRLASHQRTFVSVGTLPKGSTWSMIPMPPTLLGPCCIPGPNDTETTPHRCLEGEQGVDACGTSCAPCPMTPGSDCSRCDQVQTVLPDRYKSDVPQFPPPCPSCQGVDWNGLSVRDLLRVPKDLKPGKYILGFRYDCEATAQVWSNCADITIV